MMIGKFGCNVSILIFRGETQSDDLASEIFCCREHSEEFSLASFHRAVNISALPIFGFSSPYFHYEHHVRPYTG